MARDPAPEQRKYRSTLRARQVEQTRREILDAAVRLFAQHGWARTTLAAVAAEAGVAVETVYNGFRSKKALLRAAMDVAIVGDADPVPLIERDMYQRLLAETPEHRLEGGAEMARTIYSGPAPRVWSALIEAAAGDPEVARWCAELEESRRVTMQQWLELTYGRPFDERTLDVIWWITSIETYTKLCVERAWTIDQWQEWLVDTVRLFAGTP